MTNLIEGSEQPCYRTQAQRMKVHMVGRGVELCPKSVSAVAAQALLMSRFIAMSAPQQFRKYYAPRRFYF